MCRIILPPVPALYRLPQTIADLVDHALARALDCFGIEMPGAQRWGEDDSSPESTFSFNSSAEDPSMSPHSAFGHAR